MKEISMFKKKPKAAKAVVPSDDLVTRLFTAEDHLEATRADAIIAAKDDPEKLAALSESASRLEFEIAALTEALKRIEVENAEAEEAARREADKKQREQTSHDLRKIAADLEKAAAPFSATSENLRVAVAAALPVIGQTGLADLLGNLRVEIPAAVELFVSEIRARADQTLAGEAPPILPKPFVPTIIEEEKLPEITVFVLDVRITWPVDAHGRRQSLGPYQIGSIPEFWAKIALERGLAIEPTSDRYKAMRAEAVKTGWPHVSDPMACRDLDRDPNTAAVHNFNTGRKLRDEPTFTRIDRGPPRKVEIEKMLPK
jgi:hypothetical protein